MRRMKYFTVVLCCFFLLIITGCKTSDNNAGSLDSRDEATPTEVIDNTATADEELKQPTDIPTGQTIGLPSESPSPALPAVTDEEETLDDLSVFMPLQDCFLDYAFQVEELGVEEYSPSYQVKGSYDLDSDGKEDSISILLKGQGNDSTYIEVNETRLSFSVEFPIDGEVHIVDLDQNDRYLEVACYDDGPSGDPSYIFFRYDGSSIYQLGQIDAYASIDGRGRLISSFHRSNYFKPSFCSAWYEISNNSLIRKDNDISRFLGQTYEFAGGDAYFIPYEELPEHPEIRWEKMKQFEACQVKLIDIWGIDESNRILNYFYVELPSGEKGLMYFWIGD